MRFKKIIIASVVSALLTGCGIGKSEDSGVPNEKRGTDYTYDFIDYLDIKAYGPDGKGIIEVTPRVYSVSDFASEQEYISIKKLMDEMNLVYIQGEDNKNSCVAISKVSDLTNGDIVTIGIDTKKWKGKTDIDINLEDYEFVVDSLTDGKTLDLFNDESVIVYGLEGTNNVFTLKTPKTATLPSEIEDHIQYTVNTSEKSLTEKVSICDIKATMDEEFLLNPSNPYYNIDIYLKKHGYDSLSETQTVLDKVISPIVFDELNGPNIGDFLASRFIGEKASTWSRDYNIDRIGNIQQEKEADGIDKYKYIVTAHAVCEDGTEDAFRASMYIWMVNGEIILNDISQWNYSSENGIIENPINDSIDLLYQYYYEENKDDAAAEGETTEGEGEETEAGEETKNEG